MIDAPAPQLWNIESTARPPLTPIWRQLATFSLIFALVDGFGAWVDIYTVAPMKYVALQVAMLIATVVLCPRGSLAKVFLPLSGVTLVGWWLLSYTWDKDPSGWISASTRDLSTVVTVVILAQILGRSDFGRCLLVSGYIAIGLIFVALVIQPGLAYETYGAAPGLHGGFTHKNTMAPCLLLISAAVMCLHPSRVFRGWFVAFTGVLLFLGQTMTGLATLAALVMVNWMLVSYKRVVSRLGRSAGTLLMGALLLVTLVAAIAFSAVVRWSGKDLTFSSRTTIWDGVNDAIRRHPWRGYGYGVWENLWMEPIRTINIRNGFLVAHAHNAALDMLLRLGIIGLALLVVQLFSTMRSGWRLLMRDDSFGRLALLYCTLVISVGFSESLTAFGVWAALLISFGALSRTALRSNADTSGPST